MLDFSCAGAPAQVALPVGEWVRRVDAARNEAGYKVERAFNGCGNSSYSETRDVGLR